MHHRRKYPLATQAVMNDFYVDNGLDGADSIDEAIKLLSEMQELFEIGGFVLWCSFYPAATELVLTVTASGERVEFTSRVERLVGRSL